MSLTFKVIIEHTIKTLEEETMLGLFDIITKMHKHTVQDHTHATSCYYDEDLDDFKTEVEFNKIFTTNFFEMFEHIEDDFKYRLENLKFELMKRFDINSDGSSVASINLESESECESECDNKNV